MKKLILLCCVLVLAFGTWSQVSKTITVTTAGTLTSLLTDNEKSTITNLTIEGTIDARDIVCLRDNLSSLRSLDMSAVTIQSYDGVRADLQLM